MTVSCQAKDNKRLHRIWRHMKERCYSENCVSYHRYGGRGITVCDEWKNSFQTFCEWALKNGFDPDADRFECSLDRIDNDGDYTPENCRWVDIKTQQRNRRNNRIIEFCGARKTATEWAELVGIERRTMLKRLKSGWSIEAALTTPLTRCKSHRKERRKAE